MYIGNYLWINYLIKIQTPTVLYSQNLILKHLQIHIIGKLVWYSVTQIIGHYVNYNISKSDNLENLIGAPLSLGALQHISISVFNTYTCIYITRRIMLAKIRSVYSTKWIKPDN